jgi:hypothetical protein
VQVQTSSVTAKVVSKNKLLAHCLLHKKRTTHFEEWKFSCLKITCMWVLHIQCFMHKKFLNIPVNNNFLKGKVFHKGNVKFRSDFLGSACVF